MQNPEILQKNLNFKNGKTEILMAENECLEGWNNIWTAEIKVYANIIWMGALKQGLYSLYSEYNPVSEHKNRNGRIEILNKKD